MDDNGPKAAGHTVVAGWCSAVGPFASPDSRDRFVWGLPNESRVNFRGDLWHYIYTFVFHKHRTKDRFPTIKNTHLRKRQQWLNTNQSAAQNATSEWNGPITRCTRKSAQSEIGGEPSPPSCLSGVLWLRSFYPVVDLAVPITYPTVFPEITFRANEYYFRRHAFGALAF